MNFGPIFNKTINTAIFIRLQRFLMYLLAVTMYYYLSQCLTSHESNIDIINDVIVVYKLVKVKKKKH